MGKKGILIAVGILQYEMLSINTKRSSVEVVPFCKDKTIVNEKEHRGNGAAKNIRKAIAHKVATKN